MITNWKYIVICLSFLGGISALISCKNHTDGVYATDCSSQVTRCRNERSFVMFCEDNLFYDSESGGCIPLHLSTCLTSADLIVKGPEKDDCQNKESGFYGYPNFHPCEREYFVCNGNNQNIIRKRCADDEYFEQQSASCLKRIKNKRCSEVVSRHQTDPVNLEELAEWNSTSFGSNFDTVIRDVVRITFDHFQRKSREDINRNKFILNTAGVEWPWPFKTSPPSEVKDYVPNCAEIGPGFYAVKSKDGRYICSKYFFHCDSSNETQPIHLLCDDELVFDMNTTNCVDPSNLSICSDADKPRSYFLPKLIKTTQYNDCRHKKVFMNGDCSSEYYVCHGAEADLYQCPHGLQFDILYKQCLYPAECWFVKKAYDPVARWNADRINADTQRKLARQCEDLNLPSATTDDCSLIRKEVRLSLQTMFGKYNRTFPDSFAPRCDQVGPGYYGVNDSIVGSVYNCSKYYWNCENRLSKPKKFVCAEGLIFDRSTMHCVYPSQLPLCSVALKPRSYFAPKLLARIQGKGCHSEEQKSVEKYQKYACLPEFSICANNGIDMFYFKCQNGLHYDRITKECVYPVECIYALYAENMECVWSMRDNCRSDILLPFWDTVLAIHHESPVKLIVRELGQMGIFI